MQIFNVLKYFNFSGSEYKVQPSTADLKLIS